MPILLREERIGDYLVKIRQRARDEDYASDYAVTVHELSGERYYMHDGSAYGNSWAYIERRWHFICEQVARMQNIRALT